MNSFYESKISDFLRFKYKIHVFQINFADKYIYIIFALERLYIRLDNYEKPLLCASSAAFFLPGRLHETHR